MSGVIGSSMTNSGVIGRPVIGTPLDGSGEIGVIAAFALTTAPIGWIICNGASLLRAGTYVNLFDVIGTGWGTVDGSHFNLPDLRGAFLRGTGSHGSSTMSAGSAFAGPSVAAYQNDGIQHHGHSIRVHSNGASGALSIGFVSAVTVVSGQVTDLNTTSAGAPRGSGETRSFNAGVNYCIKF